MNPIPVAVVGSGMMGRKHLEAYRSLPEARVCGVVSRSRTEPIDDVPVFASTEQLLRQAAPRLVSVCTPTHTHPSIVEELLHAGVDVVCEKPLALDEQTGLRMLELADSLGRRLHVAHVVRFMEPYQRMAELMDSGRLGRIGTVRMRRAVPPPEGSGGWFTDPSSSGGVELDLMVHDVDFLVGRLGTPSLVYAQKRQLDDTEAVLVTYRFANGAIAITEASWGGVTELDYSCEVAGSLGNASFSSTPRAPLLVIKTTGGGAATLEAPLPATQSMDPYRLQLQHFVAETNAGEFDRGSRDQTLRTLRTSEMIAASIKCGKPVAADPSAGAGR